MLSNRYQITEPLGKGAMGEVYLAEDKVLGVSVAIKVMAQALSSSQMNEKFAKEAQIGAFLGHHNVNIVRVLDFGVYKDKQPFYVMEYVYGSTLAEEIEAGPLDLRRGIKLMSQVCAGLQSAHQGVLIEKKLYTVIHRDLKPGNIFITNNSSFGEMAKILDFGIAEIFTPVHKSTESTAMGTLAYSSHEQLQGQKLQPSADIYSLGITLFEALTGQLPIQPKRNSIHAWIQAHEHQRPKTLKEAAPQLHCPVKLEHLIQKCLQKHPKKRPQKIQEVLDDLKEISKAIGTSFAVNTTTSHEDALEEIFKETPSLHNQSPQSPSNTPELSSATLFHARDLSPLDIQTSNTPLSTTQPLPFTPKTLAQRSPWPSDKPLAEIVFAEIISTPDIAQSALWGMLKNAEQQRQTLPHAHLEFMVEFSPYPMLVWITVLHNEHGQMRCLPCYIDLGKPERIQLVKNMVQQGEFLFILFDKTIQISPSALKIYRYQHNNNNS
ncbi:MAG: serine/threonine protein kinase [Acaryochloridaceae cyanobacterium RL_2_7]|nr:serine/threonine protein kinase [Acaryochloridaceae cyanobacterium RL_2_7]